MAGTKEKLLEFIQREAKRDEATELQVIKKYGFECIFPEHNRDADWKRIVNMQNLKYSVFAMELEKIADAFQDVILVKGLWYQDKLYGRQTRFCRDVDLFVRNEDFARFDEIMKENHFIRLYENCPISNKYYYFNDVYDNTELTIDKMNHFVYEKKGLGWLKVEVHTFLLPFYRYPAVQYQEMYHRRKKITLRGFLNISVLDCNDDFVYAACHMCKHLVNAIVRCEESVREKEAVLNGKLVYDLALMAGAGDIRWNAVIERAVQWDVLQDLLIACKLVHYFWDDYIPEKEISKITALLREDKQRGMYKSLLRDIALSDISNVFSKEIVSFVNRNQINPYGSVKYFYYKGDVRANVELLNTEQGKLYSAWDEMYWYIQYNPASKKKMTLYISVVCPLYDIHAVTFFVEKGNGLKVATRGMKFAHQDSPEWLKGVQAELGGEGQYMLKIAYKALQIDPVKTKFIGCQVGVMVFNERDEVVERMSLFGKGYYHFYDMGILSCGGGGNS